MQTINMKAPSQAKVASKASSRVPAVPARVARKADVTVRAQAVAAAPATVDRALQDKAGECIAGR
jgi:hypothetical protein